MAIKKIALIEFIATKDDIVPAEKIAENDVVTARFRKIADQLREEQSKAGGGGKQLSPKVNDFLYAHCIMMHAAEASLINQDTGEVLLNKAGGPSKGEFVKFKDARGNDSYKWESEDGILPYRNGNGDIFPEEDLLTAHKEWVGKPLCRDHVSSTVDGIRGIVVDTYYDPKFKRVHALFALDRKNYGELARKVEAGYATSVSMGTAVGRSICTECSNVATIESEYCHHVRTKSCHGEINKDLSPIELSIVVTGADPKAKIMTVLAALEDYKEQVKEASGKGDISTLEDIYASLDKLGDGLPTTKQEEVVEKIKTALSVTEEEIRRNDDGKTQLKTLIEGYLSNAGVTIADLDQEYRTELLQAANSRGIDLTNDNGLSAARDVLGLETQPGLVNKEGPIPTNQFVDGEGYKPDIEPIPQGIGGPEIPPSIISSLVRQKDVDRNNEDLANKIASLKKEIKHLERQINKENIMSFADLLKQRNVRKAYWQGTEEPTPGKEQYPLMGDQDSIREKDDKHMLQTGPLGGTDGSVPGDDQAKGLIQRAELEERMAKRAAWLKEAEQFEAVEMKDGTKKALNTETGVFAAKDKKDEDDKDDDKDDKKDSKKDDKDDKNPFAKKDDDKDDKDSKDDKKDDDKDDKDSKDDKKKEAALSAVAKKKDDDDGKKAKDDKKAKKEEKEAKEKEEKEEKAAKKKKDGEKKEKADKKAYHQGTEEPTPGKEQYALMGDQDGIREKDDKQMLQTGPLGGTDGLVPGDEQVKKEVQRLAGKIGAKLYKGSSPKGSRWEFSHNGNKLFALTAEAAYGNFLNDNFTNDSTYVDLFHSKDWGSRVMKMLRDKGLGATASELGVSLNKVAAEPGALAPEPAAAPAPDAAVPGLEEEGASDADKLADLGPLINQMEEVLAEIKDVAGTKASPEEEGLGEVDVEAGPPDDLAAPPPAVASVTGEDLLKVYAFITESCNELCYLDSKASDDSEGFHKLASQAIHDAKLAHAEAKEVVANYKAQDLKARSNRRAALVAKAMDEVKEDDCGDGGMGGMATMDAGFVLDDKELGQVEEVVEDHEGNPTMHGHDEGAEGGELLEELLEAPEDDDTMDYTMDYAAMDTMARKAWRENLVKEAMKYDDIYEGERSGGGHKLEGLGISVADDGDKVETESEIHARMEEIATKPLGKIKEAAQKLDKWMKISGINPEKLDLLVAEGAVDADAAKYWKEYLSQADGGKEFADGLVKEHGESKKKEASIDIEGREVRIRRAYSLGMNAQTKRIIGPTQSDLERYVDTLKEVPEEHFNYLKAHVEQYKAPHNLVEAPMVGINEPPVTGPENGVSTAGGTAANFENLSKLFE